MSNDRIPPNPYPIKPPPNMPAPRKDSLEAENARLKAEVERLTSDLQMEKENEDRLVRLHQDARNEVERLTKAGDAMADSWLDGIRAINWEAEDVKELRDWNAAKEGKQP